MREILFRGKTEDTSTWVFGWFEKYPFGRLPLKTAIIPVDDAEDGYFHHVRVVPETVGQYTGLTVNGTKVFEGDILKFSYTGKNHGVEGTEAVVFKNGKFGVEWGWHRELVALDGFANTTMEVIGNIHDNPELIGGDSDG